jgi:hypothetical protein
MAEEARNRNFSSLVKALSHLRGLLHSRCKPSGPCSTKILNLLCYLVFGLIYCEVIMGLSHSRRFEKHLQWLEP